MRAQPWESPYGPGDRRFPSHRAVRRATGRDICILDLAEDGVPVHGVTPSTVVMVPVDPLLATEGGSFFREFARQHRIRVINMGVLPDGIAVTLGTRTEAAKFRLLWDHHGWECKVPR